MALTKTTVIDKIEVVGEHKMVHVRTSTMINEDGVELSHSFHRHVIAPNANIKGEDAEVQAVCNAVHTQAVKDAYSAFVSKA